MRSLHAFALGATMFVAAAGTAGAQINYTTTGRFLSGTAGCEQMMAANSATCSFGTWSLVFTGTTGTNIGTGSIASLGTFLLSGSGSAVVPPPSITFDLFIEQSTPSVGDAIYSGPISGRVTFDASGSFSSLMWSPTQDRTIGPVTYSVVYDNIGPAANAGVGIPINNLRGINAIVTTSSVVPEPSTYLLMGTGLVALVVTARRRKVS